MRVFAKEKIAALMLLMAVVPLRAEEEFARPHDYLGPANPEGKMEAWFDVAGVMLPDGTGLPLRLLLSGGSQRSGTLFGKFWWCPLLESTCVPVSENQYMLTTLGGGKVYLVKGEDEVLSNGLGGWKGKSTPGEGTQEVSDPEGWTYKYLKGKLVQARKGRTTLEWTYAGNRLEGIREATQGKILSVHYRGSEAVPSGLTINGKNFELATQPVPVVTAVAGVPMITRYEPALKEMAMGEVLWKFPIQFEQAGTYRMNYEHTGDRSREYVWDAVSGALVKEGEWTYYLTYKEDGRPVVNRIDAQGRPERYFHDTLTGVSEHLNAKGLLVKRTYFMNPGPTQFKIRKRTESVDGKEVDSHAWSYDEVGRLIRKSGKGYLDQWTWHPNGKVATVTRNRNGKLFVQEEFDQEGNLSGRKTANGLEIRYAIENGNRIIQRYRDGKLLATKVVDAQGGREVVFASVGNALENVPPPLGGGASPEAVQKARVMAEKAIQATQAGLKNETTP